LLDIYWNILTMHGSVNVKSPNNTSKWLMGLNSAFKGLINKVFSHTYVIKLRSSYEINLAHFNWLFYNSTGCQKSVTSTEVDR
jgi:hypothetical protein